MTFILYFFAVLFVLFLVIGIHEFGHAIAARLFHVKIKRISFGFGSPILSYQAKNGIEYVWSMWPIGGYVKLLNSRIEKVDQKLHPQCFDKQPFWKKVIILISGACCNFVVAIFAFQLHFTLGYKVIEPVIAQVSSGQVAALAGLKSGDKFVQVAGINTPSWQSVGAQLMMRLNQKNTFLLIQTATGEQKEVQIDLTQWKYQKEGGSLLSGLGIEPDVSKRHIKMIAGLSPYLALKAASLEIGYVFLFFLILLKLMITGYLPLSILLGPIGAITEMISSFNQGLSVYAYFIGYFSIAVGLVNLFPIPGLDGGSVIYAVVEKIRGKPISIAFEVLLHRLALIIFCVALVQLLVNDLHRYIPN